jgi:hypothetical protein
MYVHTINGHEIKLNNRDYNALVSRWRAEAIVKLGNRYIVRKKCSLCRRYRECPSCPLGRDNLDCVVILNLLVPNINNHPVYSPEDVPSWEARASAILYVSTIENELKKFKKSGVK